MNIEFRNQNQQLIKNKIRVGENWYSGIAWFYIHFIIEVILLKCTKYLVKGIVAGFRNVRIVGRNNYI